MLMKCKCGSIVTINENNFATINDNFVVVCNNCNRAYNEDDFSENEIEKTYWSDKPTEVKKR